MQTNYEEIVRKWYNKLKPLFQNTLKANYEKLSYDAIDDLYQDSFLAVHKNLLLGRIKEDTSWSSYIIRIGLNLASKEMRHSDKTDSIDSSPACNEYGETAIQREAEWKLAIDALSEKSKYTDPKAQKIVGEELCFMPEPCSTIIRLFYCDNMSMEDIAIAVNMKNATTVKSKKFQCWKVFKDRAKKELARNGFKD